jgi:hypothetical protein
MGAICSSETPTDTQRTTRRYFPEDGTLQRKVSLYFRLLQGIGTKEKLS